MADTIQTLLVSLEARVAGYEREMKRAVGVANKQMGLIEKRASQLDSRLAVMGKNAFGGFARGALGAVAGAVSLAAAINSIKSAFEKFGSIADASAASGLDSEFFQGIAYQASLAGVELEAVSGALATFNKNSGLAAEGRGKMVSALKALNPELLASIQAATTQEQRIRLAADAIDRATSSAQAGALATTLFGDAGSKLVAAFSGGAAQIEAMQEKARGLGVIISRDVIARADELGDEFDTVAQIVDLQLKRAIINLGPALVSVTGWIAEWTKMLNIVLDQFNQVENRHFLNPLQNDLANTYNAMEPIKQRIAEIEAALAGGSANGMILKHDLSEAEGKLAGLTDTADALLSRITELQGRTGDLPAAVAPSAPNSVPVDPSETAYTRTLLNYTNPDYLNRSEFPTKPSKSGGGGSGKSRNENFADALKNQAEENRLLAEKTALQATLNPLVNDYGFAVEKLRVAQELQSAATAAGIELGPDQRAQIEQLAEGYAQATVEAARLAEVQAATVEQMDSLREAGEDALQTVIDGFLEGKDAGEILLGVLADIGKQLISMGMGSLFGGSSGGSGLLGQLFGFEDGGYTGAGGKRKPAGVVHKGEIVWSQSDIARAGGVGVVEAMRRGMSGYADGGVVAMPHIPTIPQGGGATSISMPVTIHAPGADATGLASVVDEVRKLRSEMPTIAKKAMRDSRKYGQG